MNIVGLTVGKKHDPELAAGIEKYLKRLSRYVDFSFVIIPGSDKVTESIKILQQIKSDDAVVLLDETGRQLNTPEIAELLTDLQNSSIKRLVFVIGGAYGVNQSVFDRANIVLSFSKMVFPHQIMRLLLVEQIYRSFNLMAGGKYHHD